MDQLTRESLTINFSDESLTSADIMRIYGVMTKYILFLIFPVLASASWKFRAREHVEWHSVSQAGVKQEYFGLSNTINFWWEKPYNYSVGLAFGPLLGSARTGTSQIPGFGEKIQLFSLGVEAKYFLYSKGFVRGGVFANRLQRPTSVDGSSAYLGLGWEIEFDSFSLALEAAIRESRFSDDIKVQSFTPSVGFHFY